MFLDDIYTILTEAGVPGESILTGSKAQVPPGAGPYTSIRETGGMPPTRRQNKASAATRRPTAQLLTRAEDYTAARDRAEQCYIALDGKYNFTVNGEKYIYIIVRQEPTDMGDDPAEARPQIVFNIEAEKEP